MIYKTPSSQSGQIRVIFELPACVWADQVFLVGDFNEWNEAALPFRQDRNGVWRAAIDLPVGKQFQFRYLVDGSWRTDYHADGYQDSPYQTANSVIDTSLNLSVEADPDRPSMVLEQYQAQYREAVHGAFHRQPPPNRRAA